MSHGERWAGSRLRPMSHKIAPQQVNRGLRTARHARYPTFPRACRDRPSPDLGWWVTPASPAAPRRTRTGRPPGRPPGPRPASRAPARRAPAAGPLPGRRDPLDPDADQPDPRPVQLEAVVERPGGRVDLVPGVGRRRQRAGPGDRAEVGEPDLDAHRPPRLPGRPAAGPRSSRPAAAAPGGSPRGRRRRPRTSPRRRSTCPARPARPRRGSSAVGQRVQVGGDAVAERPAQRRQRQRGQVADRAQAEPAQLRSAVRSPTPHSAPTGSGCRNCQRPRRPAPPAARPACTGTRPAWPRTSSAPPRPSR